MAELKEIASSAKLANPKYIWIEPDFLLWHSGILIGNHTRS